MTNAYAKAFPVPDGCEGRHDDFLGLTKREYFAAMILSGLSSHQQGQVHEAGSVARARWAVGEADALINALNNNVD